MFFEKGLCSTASAWSSTECYIMTGAVLLMHQARCSHKSLSNITQAKIHKYKCKNTNINAHKDIDRASFFTLFINLECSSQKGGIHKSVGQGGLSRISGLFSPRFLVCLHRVMGAQIAPILAGSNTTRWVCPASRPSIPPQLQGIWIRSIAGPRDCN